MDTCIKHVKVGEFLKKNTSLHDIVIPPICLRSHATAFYIKKTWMKTHFGSLLCYSQYY